MTEENSFKSGKYEYINRNSNSNYLSEKVRTEH